MTLKDRNKPIGGLRGIFLDCAGRPANLNVGLVLRAQAEVQAGIVGGNIAGLAKDSLGLDLAAVVGQDKSADRAAVAFGSLETHFQPTILLRGVVA